MTILILSLLIGVVAGLRAMTAPAAATAALVSAGPGPVSTEQVLHLVSSAVLAPSGGNCQPWRFVWSAEGRLRCLHDVDRSASFLDFEHRAAYLALGAAVENVVIAAAAIGLEAGVVPLSLIHI